jgi:hypothetical protein
MTKSHAAEFVSALPRNSRNALRVILASEQGAAKLRVALGMGEGAMTNPDRATGLARAGRTIDLFLDTPISNWRQAMRTAAMFFIGLVLASHSFAQTAPVQMHVNSIHKATRDDEKTYRTSFNQDIIVGTIGNKRYTLEELKSWGMPTLEVGQDYNVVKADGKAVKFIVHGKKRDETLSLNVVTVEEVDAK